MTTFYHESIPSVPGIYRITCVTTGKIYVGSAKCLCTRYRTHFSELRRNHHNNRKLQHAFNKYGNEAFAFEVLEFVMFPEMLIPREQFWLDKLQPFDKNGFNILKTAGSNLGAKPSPETIEKLRASHIGKPGYWAGKKRPSVAKANAKKRSKSCPRYPGYTHSLEHREKLRQANLGKKASEETKRKLREKRKARVISPESIEKTRLANTGRKNSEEAIERMIDAHANDMKTLIATDPNGVEHTVTGIHQFCKEHNLDRRCVQRVASGRFLQHKGWRIRYLDNDVA